MIKKSLFIALIILLLNTSVFAIPIGSKTGNTLYTNIVATIDGYDIESYNMNDYTYVVAEDLRNYGFDVIWNEETRSLYITKIQGKEVVSKYISPVINDYNLGKPALSVYYTDIKAYINNEMVLSYNIGGKTIVPFDSLNKFGSISYIDRARRLNLDLYDIPSEGLKNNKVLNMDFSDFSGVYQDGYGNLIDLRHDGSDSIYLLERGESSSIEKHFDGHYTWAIDFEYDGYGMWLYPPGVEIVNYYGNIIYSDTSQARLYAGHDFYPAEEMSKYIYYPVK